MNLRQLGLLWWFDLHHFTTSRFYNLRSLYECVAEFSLWLEIFKIKSATVCLFPILQAHAGNKYVPQFPQFKHLMLIAWPWREVQYKSSLPLLKIIVFC